MTATRSSPAEFGAPLKRQWVRDLGGQVSYPLIANGMVFVTVGNTVGNFGSQIYALDLGTGKTVWQKLISGPFSWSNAAYENGRVFVLSYSGILQAFSADAAGTTLWSVQLPYAQMYDAAPMAYGGHVYVTGVATSGGGSGFSLSEETGAVEWKSIYGLVGSAPGFGGDDMFLTYIGSALAINPATGKLIWGKKDGNFEGYWGNTPAYYAGRLYQRDSTNGNIDYNAANGKQRHPFASDGTPAFWPSPSGKSYMITRRGQTLYATDVQNGKELWQFGGDGKLFSSALVINDTVVSPSYSGEVYLLDAATGKELWSDNVGAPIIASDSDNQTTLPWTGLGAGGGYLVVPATDRLVAYTMKRGAP